MPFAQSRLVSPLEIQPELTRIWDELQSKNKMRASLFNLIFYTPKSQRTDYIHSIAEKVIERFPSRIIFITADNETKDDFLQTGVSVIPAGQFDIVCDLIQIDVSQKNKAKVPFLILPHFLTDLPIYVIWADDPSKDDALLNQFEKMADRLIFDSECCKSLPEFAKTLIKISANCAIADLNWARMESWRNLLSSTFYSEERLADLKKTDTIQLFYNKRTTASYCHTPFQSLFLQGWIAGQLDWKLTSVRNSQDDYFIEYQRPGGKVQVALYPENYDTIQAGAIVSVELITEDQVHFSFGRDLTSPHQISMRFSTLEKCTIPLKYLFAKAESGQSLVKEISHKGTSSHYLKLLNLLQTDEFKNILS
ncbi:MAG TPA: glucose-6-phosphate dehydrogenase assembly protein OpcA [Rhabdochlamydiaceae bacterium]|nr:glucose-6-phosphate dehydrogenase assembly protein OpcA [Rhabdochlamydiaceae bacterium]